MDEITSSFLRNFNITGDSDETFWLEHNQALMGIGVVSVLGIVAIHQVAKCLSEKRVNPDEKDLLKLASEIIKLKPTISDGDSYDFLASSKQYVSEASAKKGAASYLAAGIRGAVKKEKYGDNPEQILELGRRLLQDKAGSCDHMAAAVVAKIVDHIKNGGDWNSRVELIKNGAHAFVIIGRQGNLALPATWGPKTIIVDTWLAACGVHPNYKNQISSGVNGVITKKSDIEHFVEFFGRDHEGNSRLDHTHDFSPEKLKELAQPTEKK